LDAKIRRAEKEVGHGLWRSQEGNQDYLPQAAPGCGLFKQVAGAGPSWVVDPWTGAGCAAIQVLTRNASCFATGPGVSDVY
jgi:hypothetical protein